MKEIAIVAAKRSPIGRLSGSLSALSAVAIGEQVASDLLASVSLSADKVDEIITGQVLTAGCGQNPARQIGLNIGMAESSIAMTINQVCGSGLRAVILGMQSILTEQSDIVIAGGQESMTNAPHLQALRAGVRYGHAEVQDSIVTDGLSDAFDNVLMGITAENLAEKYHISRQDQDAFALQSQQRAQAAIKAGYFEKEITPITIKSRKGEVVFSQDEHPRFDMQSADLEKMRPAFQKDGTVTAANASGINDGAAYVLLMTTDKAAELGLTPLAVIKGSGIAGIAPNIMGFGPVPACQKALAQANWSADSIDLVEANEAFAAQALSVNIGMDWGEKMQDKINISGGAIALGHPIGASGARILVTLLYNMQRLSVDKGLATLCVGGGQGVSLCVERV